VNTTGRQMRQNKLCIAQCCVKRLSSLLKGMSNASNKILH